MWMRRDRLLVTGVLAAIFTADLYFNIMPKVQKMYFRDECACPNSSAAGTFPSHRPPPPPLAPWQPSSVGSYISRLNQSTSSPAENGSKLEHLFAHPLYNIGTLQLSPEEFLLQKEDAESYYKKKLSRWNRHQKYYNTATNVSEATNILSFEPESSWVKFHLGINRYALYSREDPHIHQLLKDMTDFDIINSVVKPSGHHLKLSLKLKDFGKVMFKPMRQERDEETPEDFFYFVDFQRHNAEIAAFHLDRWEVNPFYCDTVKQLYPYNSGNRLLNIIDMAIFDFLIGNMDRHHYEIFKKFGDDGFLLHFDNARGVKRSTLLRLRLLSRPQFRLSDVMRESLLDDPLQPVLTEPHLQALDRRLLRILKMVQKCVKKYGEAHVVAEDIIETQKSTNTTKR
ncbi:FA20A Pseudokinase, partial [Polypterus senegalus]